MSFVDNIKTALGLDNADDVENYDSYDSSAQYQQPQNAPQPRQDYTPSQGGRPEEKDKVNITVTAQLQVILEKPEKFSDTKEIANHLNNKKTVVLNLESTTPDVTRRIIDFLGGVAYANGGSIKPVAHNTFIITPYNVGFQGDEVSEQLGSNGIIL
ncbi:MAG: cell division protein SepF [Oscillospiraceae bacterium]|nr:cell division protein SepF [Oscillospiraceae bacterium]